MKRLESNIWFVVIGIIWLVAAAITFAASYPGHVGIGIVFTCVALVQFAVGFVRYRTKR